MKKFSIQIAYMLSVLILLSVLLDKLFTYGHYTVNPRNEVDWLMGLDESEKLDFIALGSSRSLHHIDVNRITEKTGQLGLNLGSPGSSMFEIKLAAKHIIKNNLTDKIFIQIDYIWNEFEPDGGIGTVNWIPYINDKHIKEEFAKADQQGVYDFIDMIPFYRYCKYDSKIGFRGLLLGLLGMDMANKSTKGYIPLYGNTRNITKKKSYELKDTFNIHVKEIIDLCTKHEVALYFYTAPIVNFEGSNEQLSHNLQNYNDFSQAVKGDSLYYDTTHLNHKGAEIFTDIFIATYFKK